MAPGGARVEKVIREATIYVRTCRPSPLLRRLLLTRKSEAVFADKREITTARDELLQTRDHFDDGPQFVRSPIDHLECDVENHSQADISDPAMILQQASNEARRDAHQPNRQCKAEYQNDRMLPRGTGDSENIAERHRYVSDADLPGITDERFARHMGD